MLSELHFNDDDNAQLLSCKILARISRGDLRPHVFLSLVFSRESSRIQSTDCASRCLNIPNLGYAETFSTHAPVWGWSHPSCHVPEPQSVDKAGLNVAERIFIMDVNCFKAILKIGTLEITAADL
jgi:hypothetical protein